jgi:hypothetical protein
MVVIHRIHIGFVLCLFRFGYMRYVVYILKHPVIWCFIISGYILVFMCYKFATANVADAGASPTASPLICS